MLKDISKEEIEKKVIEVILDIIGEPDLEIDTELSLFLEYGMDSLDLLDFTFNIDEIFGVTIGSNELRGRAKDKFKDKDIIDEEGNICELALEELKKNIPEIPEEKIKYGLRQEDIPKLLNVDVFVRIISEKLNG